MPIPYKTERDITNLVEKIKNDEHRFERYFKVREYVLRQFRGQHFDLGGTNAYDFKSGDVDNFVLELVSNGVPDMAFQLPEITVHTDKGGLAYWGAKSLNHALNRLLYKSDYTTLARRSAVDYLTGYSVLWRGLHPKPGLSANDDPIDWPFSDRLNPTLFGFDTNADTWEEREYAWHTTIEYKDDLVEMAEENPDSWDVDLIKKMPDGSGDDLKRKRHRRSDMKGKVAYRTVHLPRADAEKLLDSGDDPTLHHGVLLTLGETGEGPGLQQIRKPRPYYGPPGGPYEYIGMNWIPDESVETSTLILALGQHIEYAALVAANNQSARDWKRVVITADQKLAGLIQRGDHHRAYHHPGYKNQDAEVFEWGGLGDNQLMQESRAKTKRDENMGSTAAERGALTGDATATENAIANAHATKRRAQQVATFHEGHERHARALAWLTWNTDTVVVDLGAESFQDLGPGAVFFGGAKPDKERVRRYYEKNYPGMENSLDRTGIDSVNVPFGDLDVRITMGSMGRKTDEQRLVESGAYIQTIGAASQMLAMNPSIPVDEFKKNLAAQTGRPEIVEMIDTELMQLHRAAIIQAEVPAPQGGMQATSLKASTGSVQPQHSTSAGRGSSATQTRGKVGVGV